MPKVELIYETEQTKWGDERTELAVLIDGAEVARGSYGGEPEDNSHYRDYNWVRSAIETVAKKLGAEVVLSSREVK